MARTFRYNDETFDRTRLEGRRARLVIADRPEGFISKQEARGNVSRSDKRWAKKMALSDMDS